MYDLIIIGGGPAAVTAGIYAARRKIKTLLITRDWNGQVNWTNVIENYPGYQSITGPELIKKFVAHLEKYQGDELEVKGGLEVEEIEPVNDALVKVRAGDQVFQSKTLLIATGRRYRKLGVPGEEEFANKGVSYCPVCLPPGEEIVANNSLKKIEEIGIGNKVLTIDGSFQDIDQITSRAYQGKLIKIKTRFSNEWVSLTENHPVLVGKVKKSHGKIGIVGNLAWKKADQINKEDLLIYPIISKTKDIKKIKFSEVLGVEEKNGKVKNDQETHTSYRLSNEIKVDDKFLRLAGYYLSEGSLGRQEIMFYFNKNEKEYINDVVNIMQDLFNLRSHLRIRGQVADIFVYSRLVRDLFGVLFGKNAPNKKIPHWMLLLPQKKLKEVIKGYYRGDGCMRDKDFCFVTTSRTLAYQLRDILLRFKIIASVQKREKEKINKLPGEIGKRKIRFNYDKYHIVVGGASLKRISNLLGIHHPKLDKRKFISKHAWIKDNKLYLRYICVLRKS
jgi:hypothetical protein